MKHGCELKYTFALFFRRKTILEAVNKCFTWYAQTRNYVSSTWHWKLFQVHGNVNWISRAEIMQHFTAGGKCKRWSVT